AAAGGPGGHGSRDGSSVDHAKRGGRRAVEAHGRGPRQVGARERNAGAHQPACGADAGEGGHGEARRVQQHPDGAAAVVGREQVGLAIAVDIGRRD
nr:hypothetical protein [Tanacetum cinerariifolium]